MFQVIVQMNLKRSSSKKSNSKTRQMLLKCLLMQRQKSTARKINFQKDLLGSMKMNEMSC
jgi:hypothetical protein